MSDSNWIGDPSPKHPIPMRLRNCNITKLQGGSFGWRGYGFAEMRARVLYLARGRSTATGNPQERSSLEVDHIDPYRIGGVTSHTNQLTNLRVLDGQNNRQMDYATTFSERRAKRRLRAF
jgi:hypothetical protein